MKLKFVESVFDVSYAYVVQENKAKNKQSDDYFKTRKNIKSI